MIIPDGVTFDFAGEIRLDEGGQYTGTLPSGAKGTYQIQWDTDGDGTMDDTTYVAYGAMPAHADGSKESDPQYKMCIRDSVEVPERKLLGDAVQSARFITAKKSKTLIKKLSSFVGDPQADIFKRQLYVDHRLKAENESI